MKTASSPVFIKQYPLLGEGVKLVIKALLTKRIIAWPVLPYNMPNYTIIKPGRDYYKLTQDLRVVNALVQPLAPIVPDVNAMLTCIPRFLLLQCNQPR